MLAIGCLLLTSACTKKIAIANAFPEVDKSKVSTQQGDDFDAYLMQHYAKQIGTAAPNISFKALTTSSEGTIKNLTTDFKDKIVILNFWFAQCVPCITEIPSLKELVKNYEDKDVELISITIDNEEKTKELISKHNLTYMVAANGKALAQTYGVKSYPTTFLINKKGNIERVFFGASDWDGTYTYKEIKPFLEELLEN